MKSNYVAVKNKYLAFGLAFANFKFQKHEEDNKTIYTFHNTNELQEVIQILTKYRNMNK